MGTVDTGILDALPHRPPFRFLSEVRELASGESAAGVWRVSGEESFFAGHFPGRPIVPGLLLTEALAQLSGLIALQRARCSEAAGGALPPPRMGKLAHVDVRFDASVTPPAEVLLRSRLDRVFGALLQFTVEANWRGSRAARGRLTIALTGGGGEPP